MAGARCSHCFTVLVILVVFGNVDVHGQSQNVAALGNGNIDSFLRDPNYVRRQIACVLDRGQCDRLGGQFKLAIPEVLNNNCARCTPQQAANARKLINFIQSNYPGVYQETVTKYKNRQG